LVSLALLGFAILRCSGQSDAFDLNNALIVDSPLDVASWPLTTAITNVTFDGSVSRIFFTKQNGPDRWPDVIPPGFNGPIEYTWWLFLNVDGKWAGAGFLEMWNGRDGSGDLPSTYDKDWYYSSRWAPLYGHGPIQPGEQIGFMVTSGDARDNKGPESVRERSNVVVFPASDNAVYNFPSLSKSKRL